MQLRLDKKFCPNNHSEHTKIISNNFSLKAEKHLSENSESSIDQNEGSDDDNSDNDDDDDYSNKLTNQLEQFYKFLT
jgi:hypothetical protein